LTNISDLKGATRLTVEGVIAATDLVESVHHTINTLGHLLDPSGGRRTAGLTGLVYRNVRSVTNLVGWVVESALDRLGPLLEAQVTLDSKRSTGNQALRAALNGVVGDYLAACRNPLALTMELRWDDRAVELDASALSKHLQRAVEDSGGHVVLLVHGLCMSAAQWSRRGHDHGAALARDLGVVPLYLQYNSGLHISQNGRALDVLLEKVYQRLRGPLQLTIVAHSMGGLVARSACHYGVKGDHGWSKRLKKLIFLGTPHHGAPLERGGSWADLLLKIHPYSAPFARLTEIRSAGITDLRYGNLCDTDWQGKDRFAISADSRRAVCLPAGVKCYVAAAVCAHLTARLTTFSAGDGVVPLDSALGRHRSSGRNLSFLPDRQWIGYGMNHLDLLDNRQVYAVVKQWIMS
jgi:pimeloyl-ACP methyl ester carboxylesterase